MKYVLVIVALILIFVVIQTIVTKRRISISKELTENTTPYSREVEGANVRILIIGDSTAVGVGALQPEHSIAGRVGETFPDASIINEGVIGEKTEELEDRLSKLEGHYTLIMLHIGANDVVQFTNLRKLEESIEHVLGLAKERADHVMLATSGSLGTTKLLPLGSRTLYEYRTRKVREIFMDAAENHAVPYVDLFKEKKDDPFFLDPEKYFARDFFHPSGEGYGDFYINIEKTLKSLNI